MVEFPTVPARLERTRREHGARIAQQDLEGTVTLQEILDQAARLAEGLRRAGVRPGDRVGLFADNSRRWIVVDLALQISRAISVPRGTDTPPDEIAALFAHAEVGLVFAHDHRAARALEGVRDRVPGMGEIVCIASQAAPGRTFDDLLAAGEGAEPFGAQAARVESGDVATIIYTSGTTGRPKGVVLTQRNFGHQVAVLPPRFRMLPVEVFVSILPPWHIFERTVEYAALAAGARIAYTTRRRFKEDLARFRPTFVPSVPRLWETVYDGVRKALAEGSPVRRGLFRAGYRVAAWRAWGWDRLRGCVLRVHRPRGLGVLREAGARALGLVVAALTVLPWLLVRRVVFGRIRKVTGGRLRGAISGGGLLPAHMDEFFRVVGVPILIGYGLTETSPVVTVREEGRNVLGTIGTAIEHVEVQIRHLETNVPLPAGQVGVIWTRGPQVMQGYYRDDDLTRQVVDRGGWFNTGDLGLLTEYGDLCFAGRAKETIVLAGGENVDPGHVEQALVGSPLIAQAIVVGQDRKLLAALLVPEVETVCRVCGLDRGADVAHLAGDPRVREALRQEAIRRTAPLKPFERVRNVQLLPEALDPVNGCLTQTLKPRRHVIHQRYAELIDKAYEA